MALVGDDQHTAGPVAPADPARLPGADASSAVEEKDELAVYADKLAEDGSAPPEPEGEQQRHQRRRDGEDPADLDADRVGEPDHRRVGDPCQEEDDPQAEVDDREDAHVFIR